MADVPEIVKELKGYMADEVAAKVTSATKELQEKVDGYAEKAAAAEAKAGELATELEALKQLPALSGGGVEVKPEDPKVRWAKYYRNLFKAIAPHQQVVLRGFDGGERSMLITPQDRVKALEELQQICRVDKIDKAAWAEGTSTIGGYVVPTPQDLVGEIMRIAEPASVALQDCNVYPMRSWKLPLTTDSSSVTVAWEAEAATLNETEPSIGRTTLEAKKLAAYAKMSNELLADADANVVEYINMRFAEAMGTELDDVLFNGTGTSGAPFTGIFVKGSVVKVTLAATGTTGDAFNEMTGTHLSAMISELHTNKLRGAKFYMHRTTMHLVRTLTDSNGNYLYHPFSAIGPSVQQSSAYRHEGEVWGIPARTCESIVSTSAANTAFVALGNLKRIWLGKRQDFTMALDPYGLFINDQVRLRVTSRWAIAIPQPAALAKLMTAPTS